jgi:hypothetical protein
MEASIVSNAMSSLSTRPSLSIDATYGSYPCTLKELGPVSAVVDHALLLPEGHRAQLSFRAAGEWFRIAADVRSCLLQREASMDAGHPIYRTDLELADLAPEVAIRLRQVRNALDADTPRHTEALQFEIVGS